jgi:hypothetical protein
LTSKRDLDLEATDLGLILKLIKKWQTYWMDTTTIAAPEIITLTSKCDLDLEAADLGLVRNKSSSCVWHVCQVIFNLIKKWQLLSRHDHHCSTGDYDFDL